MLLAIATGGGWLLLWLLLAVFWPNPRKCKLCGTAEEQASLARRLAVKAVILLVSLLAIGFLLLLLAGV